MNTIGTGSSKADVILYLMTLLATTMADHWYLIGMFSFGAIHAYVGLERNKREKELHRIKVEKMGANDASN